MIGSNGSSRKNICTVSTKNILAFSTSSKASGYNTENILPSYIYVLDILSPWDTFEVCSKNTTVTSLEWNTLGELLLIADKEGSIEIWKQKHSLHEWFQVYAVTFPGEEVLKCKFFHNGRSSTLQYERKDTTLYLDKFVRYRFCPSVRLFGGTAAEGCIIIFSSGLLGAFVIPQSCYDTNKLNYITLLDSVTHSLGLTRHFISSVSIAYGKKGSNGVFRISFALDSSDKVLIQNFIVNIKQFHSKLIVSSRSLPSFFLNEKSHNSKTNNIVIRHLIETIETDESLVVVKNKDIGSRVELWALRQEVVAVNKFFSANKTEMLQSYYWKIISSLQFDNAIVNMCVSKSIFENTCIFLALKDCSVQMLDANLKLVARKLVENELGCRQAKSDVSLIMLDVTTMGQILIAIDSAKQIHIFKVPQSYQEQINQTNLITCQMYILEYSFLIGYDVSDTFLCLQTSVLDIIDKITENFSRQPSYIRQYYYANFLLMKAVLCRKQAKRYDLNFLLSLHSVLISFKNLLRPSELLCLDKGPVENLSIVLAESVPDIDKVIFNLEASEFAVESLTLQSLQPLIQWIGDLALNILSRIPQSLVQVCTSPYEISKDIVAINSIRELLVMVRIWGVLNAQCLPTFIKSLENIDVIATIFRLMTRLAFSLTDPDDMFLDECCILPTQVLIPELDYSASATTLSSQNISSGISVMGVIPENMFYEISEHSSPYACRITDSVRLLKLGKQPSPIKQCIRCGFHSCFSSFSKTVAMRAWEERWTHCKCRGNWKIKQCSSNWKIRRYL